MIDRIVDILRQEFRALEIRTRRDPQQFLVELEIFLPCWWVRRPPLRITFDECVLRHADVGLVTCVMHDIRYYLDQLPPAPVIHASRFDAADDVLATASIKQPITQERIDKAFGRDPDGVKALEQIMAKAKRHL